MVLAYASEAVGSTSDLMYGYVTADVEEVENEDGDAVYQVTFWDGAEQTLLTVDKAVELKVGDAFSYKLEDGAVDVVTVYTDYVRAITAWDGENMTFYGQPKTYTVDEDTVIIYVDTEEQVGVEGGKIVLASKPDGENYAANVLVRDDVKDADNALEIIFVDVNNEWN